MFRKINNVIFTSYNNNLQFYINKFIKVLNKFDNLFLKLKFNKS